MRSLAIEVAKEFFKKDYKDNLLVEDDIIDAIEFTLRAIYGPGYIENLIGQMQK